MDIFASRKSRSFLAIALLLAMLIFLGFTLLEGYRKENQRLFAEIEESLGASSVGQCMANILAQRDSAYQPLLNRFPLTEYLNSNPPTVTSEQQHNVVPFQIFLDRYQAIWDLSQQPESRKAPTSEQFSFGADPLVLLSPEFEGMNRLLIPSANIPLSLQERVEWAARSLECTEGYLGGGFVIDEYTRCGLIVDWLKKCRFLVLKLETPDHLKQLLTALDGVESPMEGYQRAMRMTYVQTMELWHASHGGSQGASTPFFVEPELHNGLSQLKDRVQHLDQPIEPFHRPWYQSPMAKWHLLETPGDDFINDTHYLSHELAAGIEFFRQAVEYRIARLEVGDQATAPQGITVKSAPSGQIRVISKRKPVTEGVALPDLFEPYIFPE
ncbi:MAG: hypothetical protein AAEJ04_00990 [Planctomycetota bacterium]